MKTLKLLVIMKTSKIISLALTVICLSLSCSIDNNEDVSSDINSAILKKLISYKIPSDALLVAPSGDITGVTDANNIENALNTVKSTGGTVYLTDQNNGTTDNYYVSRNIVINGFNGALMGEGKDKTIINAGRKSDSSGFAPAYSPVWTYLMSWSPLASSVFQLDNSVGDVIIKDLTVLIKDNQPTDILTDGYGVDGTYIWTFIEIIGGEHNTTIENVNLEGKESNSYGNAAGFNAGIGIHVMPWANPPSVEWPFQPTKGNLTVNNVTVENVSYEALLFMDFIDGSEISIKNVSAYNVGRGVVARRISDSYVKVSNTDISNHDSGWANGMVFSDINSGLKVTENQISNAKGFASTFFWNIHHAEITKNKYMNVSSNRAALALYGGSSWNTIYQNDYKDSNLPGWTANSPNGPGAIFLINNTQHNDIFEMKFPNANGITLCQMILDYGDNIIENWQICENLSIISTEDSMERSYLSDFNINRKLIFNELLPE